MKKILFLFAIIFSATAFSQTESDFSSMSLSVVMPENLENLSESQLSQFETKIVQIVNTSGLASSGYDNNFIIYPKLDVIETNVVEGGMQNITTVSVDISLFIKQVENNILFSSVTKSIKGSGSTKQLALSNAISKIPTKDADLKKFIDSGKAKIIAYYNSKCTSIIAQADNFAKTENYEQALGLLMSVPPEATNCYTSMQTKAIALYKAYQSKKCTSFIQEAKLALSAKNYEKTFNALSQIDPSSSCYKESQEMAKQAELHITKEENKQWNFMMKQYNDAVSLEKTRINAIKDIAVQYYKSQQNNVQYNLIVR